MKDNKDKKGIEYYVALVWIVLMLIGSVLGSIAFVKTVSAAERSSDVSLFADTVQENYSFTSSNIVLPVSKYVYDSGSGNTVIATSSPTFMNFSFYFEKINGQYNIACLVANLSSSSVVYNNLDYAVLMRYKQPYGSSFYIPYIQLGGNPDYTLSTHTFNINGNSITTQKFNNIYIQPYLPVNDGGGVSTFIPYGGLTNFSYGSSTNSNYHFFMNFQCDPLFNFNVISITMGSMKMGWYNGYGFNIYANYVTYNDINGNQFTVYFPFAYVNPNDYYAYALQLRTYYLSTNFDDDISYQNGYDNGFNDGEKEGIDQGYQSGLSEGKSIGFQNGKAVGYQEGLKMADNASFLSLFGAMVDAPINAMFSMLNFNLLGFNMAQFFFALITCAIIFTVVSLLFGKR